MRKIIKPTLTVLTLLLLLFTLNVHAQERKREWRQLDSAEKKERIRERIREMKKEKIRHSRRDSLRSGSQFKVTSDKQGITGSTDPDEEECEVSLACHPADSNKVVVSFMTMSMMTPLDFPVYYSSNGGKNWSRSAFSPLDETMNEFPDLFPIGGGDPVFAWDKKGRVYMSWLYMLADMNMDTIFSYTMWAYSDNSGQTWQMEQGKDRMICIGAMDMNQDMFDNYEGIADRQWLAVDNSDGPNQGNLYCSSFFVPGDEDMNKVGVGMKVKPKNATAFGPNVVAYNGETQFANVEVDKNGIVHVSFADLLDNRNMHVSSSDAGQSFSQAHSIGSSGQNLFGSMGILHERENAATNLAVDRNGNLHVVWGDFSSTNCLAFYSRSADGGNTWSTPLDLLQTGGFKHAMMPVVAADKDVSISFTGVDSKDSANYYQINSTNGGTSFGGPSKISLSATYYGQYVSGEFFGDYNRSVRSSCMDYSAWTDGRGNAGPKVYFAATNHCTLGIRDITAINTGIQLMSVYPNPARETVHLDFELTGNEKIYVTVSDIAGRKIAGHEFLVSPQDHMVKLPVSNLTAGHFVLNIYNKENLILRRNITVQ